MIIAGSIILFTALFYVFPFIRVVGDSMFPTYLDGQLLHSYRLTITHPTTNARMTFTAPLPEYFIKVYNALANKEGLDDAQTVMERV